MNPNYKLMRKIFLLAIIFFPMISQAWTVRKLRGSATVTREGKEIPLSVGSEVLFGDIVTTKPRSRVQLNENGSQLMLGGGTKLKVTQGGQNKSNALNLVYGKIRAKVEKSAAGKYVYKTKTAVAGVRGTEFFMYSDEVKDLVCTLKGSVEVETGHGKKFVVSEGKGLNLSSGASPTLSDNSRELVDLWVAQTSVEGAGYTLSGGYELDKRFHSMANTSHFYGVYGFSHYCLSKNRDFDNFADDKDLECKRTFVSPFFQWGKKNKLFVRPMIFRSESSPQWWLDNVPYTVEEEITSVAMAEFWGEYRWGEWRFRAGLQEVEWADGVLLSKQMWSYEPRTHLAFRALRNIGRWELEVLGGPGVREGQPLKGYSHIKTAGVKFKAPLKRATFYALHTNFGEWESGLSHKYHGHEINHLGLFSHPHFDWGDVSLSAIYQRHEVHRVSATATGKSEPVDGNMLDYGATLNIGHFWSSVPFPMALQVRGISATRHFVSILEDYYAVGMSGLITNRGNLEQRRFKLELEPIENHSLYIEYLTNHEYSARGFHRHLAVTKDGQEIGAEMNLVYRGRWQPHWQWYLGYWTFDPGKNLGNHQANGYFGRLEFSY